MNDDCELRQPGEDFCADCPLRPVRKQCVRKGYCQRTSSVIPASPQTRVGLFLLSATALMLVPVVVRNIYRVAVIEHEGIGDFASSILITCGVTFGLVTVVAALVGIYYAVWQRRA